MSGVSTFILNSSTSPARSHALSLDPCAYDTLLDTFGLGLTASTPEARASPNGEEEERESDPPAAVDDLRRKTDMTSGEPVETRACALWGRP